MMTDTSNPTKSETPVQSETRAPLVLREGMRGVLRNGMVTAPLRAASVAGVWFDPFLEIKYSTDGQAHNFNPRYDIIAEYVEAPPAPQEPVKLVYKNWRGETAEREIIPRSLRYGSTEWHPEPQWLLLTLDVEKNAEREFALRDFGHPQTDVLREEVTALSDKMLALTEENARLREALLRVREAITGADIGILTCTLWTLDCPSETAVDCIDAALSPQAQDKEQSK